MNIPSTFFKNTSLTPLSLTVRVLCAGVLLCLGVYIFMIGSTTSFISQRHTLNNTIRDTHTRIALLETEFLTLQNELSRKEVLALGYVDALHSVYVDTDIQMVAFQN